MRDMDNTKLKDLKLRLERMEAKMRPPAKLEDVIKAIDGLPHDSPSPS